MTEVVSPTKAGRTASVDRTARPDAAKLRRRLADLSVLGISAVVLGAAPLIAADVDAGRPRLVTPPLAAHTTPSPPAAVARVQTPPEAAPAPALVPAPRATRRVVVVRRSRPS